MRIFIFKLTAVIVMTMQLACCTDRFSSGYTLEFPQSPEPWVSLLGEPQWRVEWLAPDGRRQIADILPGAEIELPVTWTNPVTAWPHWPGHNLSPGLFKPAGALFPLDVKGGRLCLSWEAGPDTIFYWELALANSNNKSKIPANFDWVRFRELFKAETMNTAVSKDPWLVDWHLVAEKTIGANFDRRRLVPQTAVTVSVPVPSGPWYGTSPFAEPLFFVEREIPSFPVRPGLNAWICAEGILSINEKTWTFKERE